MLSYLARLEHTGSWTETDIVVDTWECPPCLVCDLDIVVSFGELHPTIPDAKYPTQSSHRLLDRTHIRTKICPTIADLLSCLDEFWYGRIGDLEVGKILVILHEDIVLGREMLDDIGLEDESLDLSLTGDDLDICDFGYHLTLSHWEITRFDEVAPNSTLETLRLADIHHSPFRILHLVDSGCFWKIRENMLDMIWIFWHYLELVLAIFVIRI